MNVNKATNKSMVIMSTLILENMLTKRKIFTAIWTRMETGNSKTMKAHLIILQKISMILLMSSLKNGMNTIMTATTAPIESGLPMLMFVINYCLR